MANFIINALKDRSLSPWEKVVKQAERSVWKERDRKTAPPFEPQDGVYEYTRIFTTKTTGKGHNKGSCYHATLRLSFSPAPDYGWQITGVGSERIRVLGVEGGEPRRFCIDDGRVTSSGRFYWTETRDKLQHLVTGSLEPRYCAIDGRLQRDLDANFHASLTVSSSCDAKGNATRQPLQNFVYQQDLYGNNRLNDSSSSIGKKKSSKKAVHGVPLALLEDPSLTEDNTDFQEVASDASK